MKTAFISGITGQCGSYLAELLLKKDYVVIGLIRRSSTITTSRISNILNHKNFKMEYFDLLDTNCIYRLLEHYRPHEFYNLAAQSQVRVSFDVPEYTMNVNGVAVGNILEVLRKVSPKTKFYQASTSEMFGNNPERPYNEKSRLQPASPYGCAKVMAHNLVQNYKESYGLFASCGILFNNESPRRGEEFVTKKIVKHSLEVSMGLREKLILGNIDAKRDWGYSKEYMEAIYMILQHHEPDNFVVATGETHSVREFVEIVFKKLQLDFDKHLDYDRTLQRPEEVKELIGDASKIKLLLGWEPKTKFEDLVELMLKAEEAEFVSKVLV
jgi:GDPmannose 4,6-dehydratase